MRIRNVDVLGCDDVRYEEDEGVSKDIKTEKEKKRVL